MWISRFLLVFLTFASLSADAEVIINGQAPDYVGKEIMAFSYTDHFTNALQLEDVVAIDSSGSFTFQFDINEIQLINIRCDYVNAHIYVEPDGQYELLFPPLPQGQSKSINNTAMVDVYFDQLEEGDINHQIIQFNEQYNLFFKNNISLLTRISRPGSGSFKDSTTTNRKSALSLYVEKLNDFSIDMDEMFKEKENTFFHVYRKSIEADMFLNTQTEPRFIYDRYIQPFSMNIKHPEQVHFISTFFDNYFAQFDNKFELKNLTMALNSENALEQSLAEMSKDDFLENKTLREIILAFTLYSEWDNHSFTKKKTLAIINELKTKGSDETSRKLAKNVSNYLEIGMEGLPAYNFSLTDKDQKSHRLEDYKGKYLVLEFWASWCKECLKEMSLSSRLAEQYKNDFDFISISIDEDPQNMFSYLKEYPDLNQTFLHMNQDKLILDQFKVRSLPAYVVVDPLTNTLISTAPFPSMHLEEKLHKITISEKQKEIDNFDKK